MKKNVLVALAISTMFLMSCKKEDVEETTVTPTEDTAATPQEPLPLQVGNQWVYNVYSVMYDTSGNITSETLRQIDTLTIIRKEVIDNQEYYVFNSCLTCGTPKPHSSVEQSLRTENGRLVSPNFKIHYSIHASPEPLDSLVIDSLSKTIYFVHHYDETVTLPAGNFENVLETVGEAYYFDTSSKSWVRNEKIDTQALYSPKVGLLHDKVFYIIGRRGYRRELVAYKLN